MSLNFDTSAIADKAFLTRMGSDIPGHMEDPTKEYWSHEITAVVHWSMIVSLSSITEANHEKWYARYVQFMLATGAPRDEWYITLDMVRKSIGLTTNVSTDTDAAYAKWIRSKIEDRAREILNGERRKLDEPTSEV